MAIFRNRPATATSFLSTRVLYLQGRFLSRLGRLLGEGFSMKEALDFLRTLEKKEAAGWADTIRQEILEGGELSAGVRRCGFPESVSTQIHFALYHGHLHEAISHAGQQLMKRAERKRKLLSIIQYPLMLTGFIIVMLFMMRYILIPHIEQITSFQSEVMPLSTRLIVMLVYRTPEGLALSAFLITTAFFILKKANSRKSEVEKLNTLTRWSRSTLFELYWSQYFAYEWGQLIKGSCSLLEVITIMKGEQSSKLVKDIGKRIENEMLKGLSFSEALTPYHFLNEELKEVIRQGELSGKLGHELTMFAHSCEEDFDRKTEQLMALIQPIVFVGVALVIIAIYAALLLPTFTVMDTF